MTVSKTNGTQNQNFYQAKNEPFKNVGSKIGDVVAQMLGKGSASIQDGAINGADSDKFSLQGGKPGQCYNLFSDSGVSLRGMIDNQNGPQDSDIDLGFFGMTLPAQSSHMDLGQTGLTVTNPDNPDDTNFISFNKNGDARIDGQLMREGEIYMLKDGGAAILNDSTLVVKTAEGYDITQTADAANDCVNVEVEPGPDGVNSDGTAPTGLFGQTFDDDKQVYTDASINMQDHEVDLLGEGNGHWEDAKEWVNDKFSF